MTKTVVKTTACITYENRTTLYVQKLSQMTKTIDKITVYHEK